MRHLLALIATLFLSLILLPAGWAFSVNTENNGNNGKKMGLTDQELDAVTAAGPVLGPGGVFGPGGVLGPVNLVLVQTWLRSLDEKIPDKVQENFVDNQILSRFVLTTISTDPLKINGKLVTFRPLAVNGVPVLPK